MPIVISVNFMTFDKEILHDICHEIQTDIFYFFSWKSLPEPQSSSLASITDTSSSAVRRRSPEPGRKLGLGDNSAQYNGLSVA